MQTHVWSRPVGRSSIQKLGAFARISRERGSGQFPQACEPEALQESFGCGEAQPPVGAGARLSALRLTSFKERDNCEDQEKHETNLGDQGRGAGKTGETQKCRDERNDEEDNGVVKHGDR